MPYGLQQQIRRDLGDLAIRQAQDAERKRKEEEERKLRAKAPRNAVAQLAQWRLHLGDQMRVFRDRQNHPDIYDLRGRILDVAPNTNMPPIYFDNRDPNGGGFYCRGDNTIHLCDTEDDCEQLGIFAHEAAHGATERYVKQLPKGRFSRWYIPTASIEYPAVAQEQAYLWNRTAPAPPWLLPAASYRERSYEDALIDQHRKLYPWDTRFNEWHVPLKQHPAYRGSLCMDFDTMMDLYSKAGRRSSIYERTTPERYTQIMRGENFAFNRADSEMRDTENGGAERQAATRQTIQDKLNRFKAAPCLPAFYDKGSDYTKSYTMSPELGKVLTDYQITDDFDYNTDLRNIMPLDQMDSLNQALDNAAVQQNFNNSSFNTDKGKNYLNSMA